MSREFRIILAGMLISVDAHLETDFTATVQFVSPALQPNRRVLIVEGVGPNADGRLKPGLVATTWLQQTSPAPALLLPASAVETVAGTNRVYVIKGDLVEERIVTTGERVGDRTEITTGVRAGEQVAANPRGKLSDGAPIPARTVIRNT